jgi:hypothetical protein
MDRKRCRPFNGGSGIRVTRLRGLLADPFTSQRETKWTISSARKRSKGGNNMKHRVEVCALWVIVLVFAMVFTMQPAAWSQAAGGRCQVVQGGNGFGGCNVPGAACGSNPNLQGTCLTGVRSDTQLGCNCVDASGGIIPSGQPGYTVAVASPGIFQASGKVIVKVRNLGSAPVAGVDSFVVLTDGTPEVAKFPTLATGQTGEHSFSLPATPSPASVVAGVFSANSLPWLAVDVATSNAHGARVNFTGDLWVTGTATYFPPPNNLLDLSSLALTPGMAGPLASRTPTVQVFEFNPTANDQAYTVKELNDLGAVVTTAVFTVPPGMTGGATITALPDFNLEIDGTGVPEVEVNTDQQLLVRALESGGALPVSTPPKNDQAKGARRE